MFLRNLKPIPYKSRANHILLRARMKRCEEKWQDAGNEETGPGRA